MPKKLGTLSVVANTSRLDWHRPTTSDTVAGGEYKLPVFANTGDSGRDGEVDSDSFEESILECRFFDSLESILECRFFDSLESILDS